MTTSTRGLSIEEAFDLIMSSSSIYQGLEIRTEHLDQQEEMTPFLQESMKELERSNIYPEVMGDPLLVSLSSK